MDTVDERTFAEKVSDAVATFGGSWKFIFAGAGFVLLWVGINTCFLFDIIGWDKYPFILLNLLLSLIAAFQAPFILMSQKRCEIKQDLIYRSLFREIKELVENDLSLENEILEHNKKLEAEIKQLKKMLRRRRRRRLDN